MKRLIIFLAIISACGMNSLAQNNEWQGNSSTNWHTAGNWSLNRVPLPTDNVEIPAAPSNQPVISAADASCNDLIIQSGASLTMSTSKTLNVGRHWTNNAGASGFVAGTGTVRFHGSNNQMINAAGTGETFYHFVMDKSDGLLMPNTNLTFLGDFNLYSGSFYYWVTGLNHTYYGNLTFNGTGGFYPGGSSTFKGASNTVIQNSGYNLSFNDMVIDKNNANLKVSMYAHAAVASTTIHKGVLEVFDFYKSSSININNGGKMYLSQGVEFSITVEIKVNSGGVFEVDGVEDNMSTVYKDGMGYYSFEVMSGGLVRAQHAYFRNMNSNGIVIHSGGIIDPDHAFQRCLFRDGEPGGVLLSINNNQDITIYGAEFPENNWGGQYNVRKTNDAGSVSFTGVSGAFSGPDHEDDVHDRIHWSDVPVDYAVFSQTIQNNESECFNALETITAQYLYILSGANVEMIAGHKIVLLPTVGVYYGGTFHAYITITGDYCENLRSIMSSADEEDQFHDPTTVLAKNTGFVKVSPNPTSGIFSLEILKTCNEPRLIIEVYSMLGESIFHTELPASSIYKIDLSGRQPGIYIVRVIRGQEMDFVKVVKR
jgi:hypothetical protein